MIMGSGPSVPHHLDRVRSSTDFQRAKGNAALDPALLDFVRLRIAKLNDCALGVAIHRSQLKARGQSDERIEDVATWHRSSAFNERERCALAMCDVLSCDSSERLCEELLKTAQHYFDREQIIALVLSIMAANDWIHSDLA